MFNEKYFFRSENSSQKTGAENHITSGIKLYPGLMFLQFCSIFRFILFPILE